MKTLCFERIVLVVGVLAAPVLAHAQRAGQAPRDYTRLDGGSRFTVEVGPLFANTGF